MSELIQTNQKMDEIAEKVNVLKEAVSMMMEKIEVIKEDVNRIPPPQIPARFRLSGFLSRWLHIQYIKPEKRVS